MPLTLPSAFSTFGAAAKAKLSNPGASGEPEDQLRAPFEQLLADLAELCGLPRNAVAAVGESSVSDLKTRPDYAVTVHGALVGFIELKASGKGADPRKFRDPHDKAQWEKLPSLPDSGHGVIRVDSPVAFRLACRGPRYQICLRHERG